MISTIKNNFYLILCTRLSSFFHHATSDHSLRCSFNRIQTVYVCVCIYVCVCMYLFINDHFKTRILWSLFMYVRMYVCILCVKIPLYPIIVHISPLPFSFSERSVTISGNRCILFRTRLIVLRSSKDIRIGAAVLVNESGWTFVHRCWRIDDEKSLLPIFCLLKQQSNDLKILINLKIISS